MLHLNDNVDIKSASDVYMSILLKFLGSKSNQADMNELTAVFNTDCMQNHDVSLIEDLSLPEDVADFIVDADKAEESDLITDQEYDSVLNALKTECFNDEQKQSLSESIS